MYPAYKPNLTQKVNAMSGKKDKYCWLYTKWGRKKAQVLIEYVHIGGKDHKKRIAVLLLQDRKLPLKERNISAETKNIEYIED